MELLKEVDEVFLYLPKKEKKRSNSVTMDISVNLIYDNHFLIYIYIYAFSITKSYTTHFKYHYL